MTFSPTIFVSPRWRWPTLAVILGMLFLARLGQWQIDRLEWRRGLNEETRAALNADPVDLSANGQTLPLAEMRNQLAFATGQYDFDNQFVIRSQTYQNRQGVYLVTPFILEEEGTTAVLVNRGWVPVTAADDLSRFTAAEQQTVNGRIQLTETLSGDRQTDVSAENELFRIDVQAMGDVLPYELLPIYLLEKPTDANDLPPYKLEADLSLDEGNHLSYALQWFSFSLLLGIIYVYYVYRSSQPAGSPTS